MADNCNVPQNRYVEVEDRSLENVVFLYRRPPLTSEWNLINDISNEKLKGTVTASIPSGWYSVEDTLQDLDGSKAIDGQVLCSESYSANTFKVASAGHNIAIVNGMIINFQGTNSVTSDNTIMLPDPISQRYDFVYLEVWRKLVSYTDSLYPYGNITQNPYSDNQILWAAIGAETTKRVQVQYRVRTESIATNLNADSDVFSDVSINPIGGRTNGEYSFATYSKFGSSDIGLYVAGDGSTDSKTALNTVDGYVYAIPMFLVYRRTRTTEVFTATTINNTSVTKDLFNSGIRKDRPDEKLADVIYADDIIDFRHKLLSSGEDVNTSLNKTVSKLLAGQLSTALKKAAGENGQISMAFSGGSMPMKVERINSTGGDDIPDVGDGSNTTSTTFKRRSFTNAQYTNGLNIIEVPRPGTTWQDGDTITLSSVLSFPNGEIVSIEGFYSPTLGVVTGVSNTGVDTVEVADTGSNSIVGTSDSLFMEYTFKYNSSSVTGFKDVPSNFIEVSKSTYLPIATRDNDVLVRFNNDKELLDFGLNPNNGDTDIRDYVHYSGGSYNENVDFGHELVVYRTVSATSIVTLNLEDSKLNGYYILGVKRVELYSGSSWGNPVDFSQDRVVTLSPYKIDGYTLTIAGGANLQARITLYTGSKFIADVGDPYLVNDSFKFFELSKQGRGVLDTYEMIEAIAVENISDPGNYVIDTGDKPIIALATKTRTELGYEEGYPFAYKFNSTATSVSVSPSTINQSLPVTGSSNYTEDFLPTRITIGATAGLGKLRVPLLVHSYVASSEVPYNFYYKFSPYQGILNGTSTFYGRFEKEGPAIITTLGSGAVTNYSYTGGNVILTTSSRNVVGVQSSGVYPEWTKYVKEGDYLSVGGSYYKILNVSSDIGLTLSGRFVGVSGQYAYEIVRLDTAKDGISNVVDRMPALNITAGSGIAAYQCYSEAMNFLIYEASLLMSAPKIKINDPLNAQVNDFMVGVGTSAKRGRNDISLTDSSNPVFKIFTDKARPYLMYERVGSSLSDGYKKVYQIYLINRSALNFVTGESGITGRLYMAVISGEVPETIENKFNPFKDLDTIDVFEISGRPIWKQG